MPNSGAIGVENSLPLKVPGLRAEDEGQMAWSRGLGAWGNVQGFRVPEFQGPSLKCSAFRVQDFKFQSFRVPEFHINVFRVSCSAFRVNPRAIK